MYFCRSGQPQLASLACQRFNEYYVQNISIFALSRRCQPYLVTAQQPEFFYYSYVALAPSPRNLQYPSYAFLMTVLIFATSTIKKYYLVFLFFRFILDA